MHEMNCVYALDDTEEDDTSHRLDVFEPEKIGAFIKPDQSSHQRWYDLHHEKQREEEDTDG
jgi:hypothetical protein